MDEFSHYLAHTNEPIQLKPSYNKISEGIRRVAPAPLSCSVFCGGKKCKYENASNWPPDACAVNGLYSHWITDDILAMARLSTPLIKEFDILGQFDTLGIKSVVNLEKAGEHASCSLEPLHSSGFAYDPVTLMDNGIYFYNYAWKDYGDASLAHLLDMVKVVSFAVSQGKVAVHCHAGLGRTGVLIACYLVYASRLRANEAVRLVRNKRPGSIQSRLHILCVQQFEQFILPNCLIFCNRELIKDAKKQQEFTLQQYLKRQRFLLHGRENKTLRHIPKILNLICERLLSLCGRPSVLPVVIDDDEPISPVSSLTGGSPDLSPEVEVTPPSAKTIIGVEPLYKAEEVVRALLSDHIHLVEGLARYVRQYRIELNRSGVGAWIRLSNEKNLYVLTALLYLWMEHLKSPILGPEELTNVVLHAHDIQETLRRLPPESASTLDYLLHFVANLDPEEHHLEVILRRIGASLTHRIVPSTKTAKVYLGFHTTNHEKGKPRKLNEGTLSKMMLVLNGLVDRYKNGILVPIEVTITKADSN
ncbi:unnamed protein product [Allacma fusca]|uniref:Protein tyrosine phosphatase domain-containing protein 1 n=1 Tax=Allacma fusca TaxID=39272 RepID=A0A8J2PAV5_9HEXA|nr:unnamed protein product [Allacma fusca]